ncbi:MAG: 7-carboxy-7-deazaguanine synthase QueE, partial [Bacteroidota bacterium]
VKLSAEAVTAQAVDVAGPVRFCVLTGGEPLLQADAALVSALRAAGFTVAVETNGTQRLADAFGDEPDWPDWIVCSPKLATERTVIEVCDELKLVVPDYRPEAYASLAERVRPHGEGAARRRALWLQPEDGPRLAEATRLALDLVFEDPRWRVSVQTHKALGVD